MRLLFFITACLGLAACNNNTEIGLAKDVNPESIYYDYQISGEEEKEDVVVLLQYRFGGKNGTTLVLDDPSNVSVDGSPLKTDSASFSGAFYELLKPAKQFAGSHTIVFTDKNKKQHTESFRWQPFSLAAELPQQLPKQPFTIKLKDFPSVPTAIRLVLTDTAFSSRDVNEEMRIERGELKITAQMLAALKSGPVTMEIYSEEDRPVKNGSKEGGRIQITYGLKRQFELQN